MKRSSINFKDKTILIQSCIYHDSKNGTYEKPTTKNNKPRLLSLSDRMIKILADYMRWHDEQREAYGDMWTDSEYLFTGETGGMMNPDTITQYLKRLSAIQRKKDPTYPHLNPHAFRHAVASNMLADGMDIITVADYLGDTSNTIATRYAHIINQARLRACVSMNDLVFGTTKK